MKESLQFCHDFQNRGGCTRRNCKFIHCSKEEQNTYLATGQIPRVLAEQDATSAAVTTNMQSNAETIPQIAMFISESYMSQPPPAAPWPPLPPPAAVLPPVATAPPPPPPTASPPRHAAGPSIAPAQQLTAPTTPASGIAGVAQHRPVVSSYSGMPQASSVLFSVNQPAAVVPEKFDPSKPPPPLPSHMQPANNSQLKRKLDTNGNAATCRKRKSEGPEVSEQQCESCVQRELRIDGYKQQMEALHDEEETQILLYKKKLQEYEIGRDILKKLVGPELFVLFDNLIEGAQSPQMDSAESYSGSPAVRKEAVMQLIRMMLDGGTRNIIDPAPSSSHMDERLQSLTSMARRQNVASYANAESDLVKYVVDTLRSSSAAERPRDQEVPGEQRLHRTNGYLANGQKPQASTGDPARYAAPTEYAAPSVQVAPPALPGGYAVAGPSGYGGAPPAAPPGAYMYHPAVPPPNRHYYPQNPAASGNGGMPYNGTERAPGPAPAPAPTMQPPAVPGPLRPAANAPNYNYMARYPQPPYFPPYQ